MVNEELLQSEIQEVRAHRTWFLVIGILLIIFGTLAVVYAFEMTIVSMIFFGWLLIVGGVFEVIHGITRRQWKGFFVNLLGGVLYTVTGLVILANPHIAAITLTLTVAMVLIAAGLFRIFVAFTTAMEHRGWLIFNGAISIVLGLLIWRSWPVSGLWIIGLFIGIDMIVDGWTEVMLVLAARRVPA
jgi:uncharacterized membrane protein HdeD (DUF308 family)